MEKIEPSDGQLDISKAALEILKKKTFERRLKILFKVYYKVSNTIIMRLGKIGEILMLLGKILVQCQIVSLMLAKEQSSSNNNVESVKSILAFTRVDYVANNLDSDIFFDSVIFSVILSQLIVLFVIYIQISMKLNVHFAIPENLYGVLNFILENILHIPLLTYGFSNIMQLFVRGQYYSAQYSKTIPLRTYASAYIPAIIIGLILITLNSLFKSRSKSHSKVSIFHIISLSILTAGNVFLDSIYFYILSSMLGVFMISKILIYFPYYEMKNNLLLAGLWATVIFLGLVFLITINLETGVFIIFALTIFIPGMYALLYLLLEHAHLSIVNGEIKTPYDLDIKIRHLIAVNLNAEALQILEIGKKQFNGFIMLYLWEYQLYIATHNEYPLNLLKSISVKLNFNTMSQNMHFSHFPALEAKFLYYYFYKESIKDTKERLYLKSIINLMKFKSKDYETCLLLLKITRNILSVNKNTLSNLKSEFILYYSHFLEKIKLFKYRFKAYGNDEAFKELHNSFEKYILVHQIQAELNINPFKQRSVNNSSKEICLVFYHSAQKFASIIHLSPEFILLAKIKNPRKLLFKSLFSLFPFEIREFLNQKIISFIRQELSSTLNIQRLFMLVKKQYYIEVSVTIKFSFLNCNPYYIGAFTQLQSDRFIALLQSGGILAFSKHFKKPLKNKNNIMEVYPDIFNQFINNSADLESCKILGILKIDKVYLGSDVFIFHFDSNVLILPNRAESMRKKTTLGKKISIIGHSNSVPSSDVIISNRRFTNSIKILKFWNIIIIFLLLIASLAIMVLLMHFMDNNDASVITFNLGEMRHLVISIAFNVRSLQLLKNGFPADKSENFYLESITNSSITLKQNLKSLSIDPVISIMNHNKLLIYEIVKGNITTHKYSLADSLLKTISISLLLVEKLSSNRTAEDEQFFLYANGLVGIFNELNITTWTVSKDLTENSIRMINYMYVLQLFTIFPPIFLILISLPLLLYIEKINSDLWQKISCCSHSSLKNLFLKLTHRLKAIHCVNSDDHLEYNREKLLSAVWPRYIMKLSMLVIISVLFSLICIVYSDALLNYVIKLRVQHMFWGSMRKSMTTLTYFWGREVYYSHIDHSFGDLDNSELNFDLYGELADYYEHIIFTNLNRNQHGQFDYSESIELLIGNSCSLLPLDNCINTKYFAKGLDPGLALYQFDLEYLLERAKLKVSDHEMLIMLENNAMLFEGAWDTATLLLNEITQNNLSQIKTNTGILTAVYIIMILFAYIFIIRSALNHLRDSILSKSEFLQIFAVSNSTSLSATLIR